MEIDRVTGQCTAARLARLLAGATAELTVILASDRSDFIKPYIFIMKSYSKGTRKNKKV